MRTDTAPPAGLHQLSEQLFTAAALLRVLEEMMRERVTGDPTGLAEDQRRVVDDCRQRVHGAACAAVALGEAFEDGGSYGGSLHSSAGNPHQC